MDESQELVDIFVGQQNHFIVPGFFFHSGIKTASDKRRDCS